MKSILITILLLVANPALAATITAASASLANVQTAVDSASNGDTVLIPNGSVTWTAGIATTKQIIIRAQNYTPTPAGTEGAGTSSRNVTILNNSDDPLFSLTSGNSFHCGVGGIRFDDGTGDGAHVNLTGSGTKVPLIFDNYFQNRSRNFPADAALTISCRGGVYWNNYMQGLQAVTSVGEGGMRLKDTPRAWTTASTMGTNDTSGDINFYVEDSTFKNVGACPDIDDHGRWVARHFVYDGAWGATHGFTSTWGGRHWEYYDGHFKSTTDDRNFSNRYFWCRAGTGLFTDNIVDEDFEPSDYGGSPVQLNIGDNTAPSGEYLISKQPGCGHNGTTYVSDPIYIWNQTGVNAYDWSFQGSPGDWSTVVQNNRDIFVNNGAKPGYTKFTYPHPLRSEIEGGGSSGSGTMNVSGAVNVGTIIKQ